MKMKNSITMMVIASLLVSTAAFADEAKEEKKKELKPQTVCPVMGGKINKASYADHEGQRIYVCCAGCLAPLKKDAPKYIKKMAENGEKPATLQTMCPVMGGKINKKDFIDHDGKRIYICCAGCLAPLKKDPSKYIKKMEDAGITLDTTPAKSKKTKKK
jgi:YHS domain-containing protein